MPMGRNASAPRAIKSPISPFAPQELDEEGIEKQIADIVTAAARAREAGYDGVEVMGSEGYFLNQFLVTHTNKRERPLGRVLREPDAAAGRGRAPRARGGRAGFHPDLPALDDRPRAGRLDLRGGRAARAARSRRRARRSSTPASAGTRRGCRPSRPRVPRRGLRLGHEEADGQRSASRSSPRTGSTRPRWPRRSWPRAAPTWCRWRARSWPTRHFVREGGRAGGGAEIAPCIACNQACLDHTFSGKISTCLVNPRACHETELIVVPAETRKPVAVVGRGAGGPLGGDHGGGARPCGDALRQARTRSAGSSTWPRQIPGKEEFHGLVDVVPRRWSAMRGVEPRAGHGRWTREALTGFDEVIVATGVLPRDPGIPGQDGPNVAQLRRRAARAGDAGRAGRGRRRGRHRLRRVRIPRRWTARARPWTCPTGCANGASTDPESARSGSRRGAAARTRRRGTVTLLQRKAEKPGKRLGKTHRLDPPRGAADEGRADDGRRRTTSGSTPRACICPTARRANGPK